MLAISQCPKMQRSDLTQAQQNHANNRSILPVHRIRQLLKGIVTGISILHTRHKVVQRAYRWKAPDLSQYRQLSGNSLSQYDPSQRNTCDTTQYLNLSLPLCPAILLLVLVVVHCRAVTSLTARNSQPASCQPAMGGLHTGNRSPAMAVKWKWSLCW